MKQSSTSTGSVGREPHPRRVGEPELMAYRAPAIENILRQHAEQAAFLWTVYDYNLLNPEENEEMDEERMARLVERLTFYKEKYTDDDGHLDAVLESAVETPESNGLVRNFVDRVLVDGEGL